MHRFLGLLSMTWILPFSLAEQVITLEGLPVQVIWADINGDSKLDLLALMLVSQTEGNVETFFVDGNLRGVYEDETYKEKYLATWIAGERGWKQVDRMELGRETILSLAADRGGLMLWLPKEMIRHRWTENGWVVDQKIPTPGLLASEAAHLKGFPFWQVTERGTFWLVPDLDGIHLVSPAREQRRFIPYPEHAFLRNRQSSGRHEIRVQMPDLVDIDGDGIPEMVFSDKQVTSAWPLSLELPPKRAKSGGLLVDMNADGLADLVEIEVDDDIERRRDLPKIKSNLKIYLARTPLSFPEEPDLDQDVKGMVIAGEDFSSEDGPDIQLPAMLLDLNSDGRMDVAGLAFKLSGFQIAKVVATQRMTMKFLLNLSLQGKDGRFQTLAGGPYEMAWRMNLRRLRLPTFAQMSADFDGDGWVDIMMEKKSRIQVTPLSSAGFGHNLTWSRTIPRQLRDPDQLYGKDLNGNGKAEFVLMKIDRSRTYLGVLEHGQ